MLPIDAIFCGADKYHSLDKNISVTCLFNKTVHLKLQHPHDQAKNS
jgi:hypothetical protein